MPAIATPSLVVNDANWQQLITVAQHFFTGLIPEKAISMIERARIGLGAVLVITEDLRDKRRVDLMPPPDFLPGVEHRVQGHKSHTWRLLDEDQARRAILVLSDRPEMGDVNCTVLTATPNRRGGWTLNLETRCEDSPYLSALDALRAAARQ